MNNLSESIKRIIIEEFTQLINNMEFDFKKNYDKKTNNFLLNQLDSTLVASMVFVSSFESKSGNAIEEVAQRVARLKFGNENVPSVVNPLGIKHNIDEDSVKGQIVISNTDFHSDELRGNIAQFRAKNMAYGRGRNRVESSVTQEKIENELFPLHNRYLTKEIHTKPVDLAFRDEYGKWNIFELKAGGDLDSSNAPSNVEKLLTIYVGMGLKDTHVFFGTLYNKDGEGNTWKGIVKAHLNYPSMFAIGKNFWEMILPSGISFDDFVNLYHDSLVEIDLSQRISQMLKNV
ncbi:TdeIII family type II restriction endonuclease [Enterococcus cecorum]|uniref:TdeIII family type II restriction endonuclease n=1 Tax=Enterococcus cecorum TaxID=44008 RepID=UPI002ACA1026|nr:TdeIII family type II restriction endonuclease [Enterococcus cecorum]MDZ5439684.1 TdeIII family type II restriction endonuclease [Enterococcus cecorum]MDZ5497818.1 TdeIII family type II restriction endonuclease [Enterococcus cecorum]MDZ5499970.1 TdeIII family type II restriction endonuclease [Enterococcus cecorum]MDZ5563078.1 TdeIII family type II restriction endonuclease [Enterococcus cecorum]